MITSATIGSIVADPAGNSAAAAIRDRATDKACARTIADRRAVGLKTLTPLFIGAADKSVATASAVDKAAAPIGVGAALSVQIFTGRGVGTELLLGIFSGVIARVGVGTAIALIGIGVAAGVHIVSVVDVGAVNSSATEPVHTLLPRGAILFGLTGYACVFK